MVRRRGMMEELDTSSMEVERRSKYVESAKVWGMVTTIAKPMYSEWFVKEDLIGLKTVLS